MFCGLLISFKGQVPGCKQALHVVVAFTHSHTYTHTHTYVHAWHTYNFRLVKWPLMP